MVLVVAPTRLFAGWLAYWEFATSYAAYRHAMISFGVPRSDNYGLRDGKLGAPDAEYHGRGINAVSTPENKLPFWGGHLRNFLNEISW